MSPDLEAWFVSKKIGATTELAARLDALGLVEVSELSELDADDVAELFPKKMERKRFEKAMRAQANAAREKATEEKAAREKAAKEKAKEKAAKEKAAARDAALVARGKLGPHLPVLNGGDPNAGQAIALGHPAAQCIRCHSIKGSGGILGPDLSEIATRLTPEQLLESLVDPQATLAEGYGLLVATLKDGSTLTGSITKVTPTAYQLQTPDGKTVEMPRDLIASETKTSPMPSAAASLSPQELRHLLAYLFTLR